MRFIIRCCGQRCELAEDPAEEYLESNEWRQLIRQWEGHVHAVVDRKGNPPQLY
jgi:hypothetical protein